MTAYKDKHGCWILEYQNKRVYTRIEDFGEAITQWLTAPYQSPIV